MTIATLCRRDIVAVDADASPITAGKLTRGALIDVPASERKPITPGERENRLVFVPRGQLARQ